MSPKSAICVESISKEYFVAADLNLSYFAGFNRLQDVGLAGMDDNIRSLTMAPCTGLAFF